MSVGASTALSLSLKLCRNPCITSFGPATVLIHLLIAAEAEFELQRSELVYLGKQYKPVGCCLTRFAAHNDKPTSGILRSLEAVLRRL